MAEIPSRYELLRQRLTKQTGRLLRRHFLEPKVVGLTLAAVLIAGVVSEPVTRGASAPLRALQDELRSDRGYVVASGRRLDPVSTSDGRAPVVSGQVFYAAAENRVQVAVYFAPSGELTGVRTDRPEKRSDSGDWWTTDQGSLCRRWTHWDAGRVRCAAAPIAGDALNRLMASVERRFTWIAGSEPGESRAAPRVPQGYMAIPAPEPRWSFGRAAATRDFDAARSASGAPSMHPFPLTFTSDSAVRSEGLEPLVARLLNPKVESLEQPAGYLASALVLLTFCMRDMLPLRCIAILSNVAFMTYGYLAVLPPVLLLHVILLPVNAIRSASY